MEDTGLIDFQVVEEKEIAQEKDLEVAQEKMICIMEEWIQRGVEQGKNVDLQEDVKGAKKEMQEIMVDMQKVNKNTQEEEHQGDMQNEEIRRHSRKQRC